jgi:hypothetical protein
MSKFVDTEIVSVTFVGNGHWKVVVEKTNFKRKPIYHYGRNLSSIIIYTYVTTDSMSVDDYRSDDDHRQKKGEKALIRQAKWLGIKEIEKYR